MVSETERMTRAEQHKIMQQLQWDLEHKVTELKAELEQIKAENTFNQRKKIMAQQERIAELMLKETAQAAEIKRLKEALKEIVNNRIVGCEKFTKEIAEQALKGGE